MAKNKTKRKKTKVLTPKQQQEKNRKDYIKLNRNIFSLLGFQRISNVENKSFIYMDRETELDDIYISENAIIVTEYTSANNPSDHLKNKNLIFERILASKRDFITFLIKENIYPEFTKIVANKECKYNTSQLQLAVLYCSQYEISKELRNIIVSGVKFFDFPILKYFESQAKIIKKSAIFEFLEFLSIGSQKYGENIFRSGPGQKSTYTAQILPEDHSSFSTGQKVVSFYIDAQSLLKRAYVLRRDGWKNIDNVGHYQRMLMNRKINSMRKYLITKERVFVNNIIATISTDDIKLFDKDGNEIKLRKNGEYEKEDNPSILPARIEIEEKTNIIGIIDGQHRTYSYYEGTDSYETMIAKYRKTHNLLLTTILSPATWNNMKRLRFEANLFMEINATQSSAGGHLKQEVELIINPHSTIAISKRILNIIKKEGPVSGLLENYWFDNNTIKTTSIVSYGLKPLVKIDTRENSDSLFSIWDNPQKHLLKEIDSSDTSELLEQYIIFAADTITTILNGYKRCLCKHSIWRLSKNHPDGMLSASSIIGMLNSLRFLIKNEKKIYNLEEYFELFKNINHFKFKEYKSSQYVKMGESLYLDYLSQKNV